MEGKEFEIILKKIQDKGLFTVLHAAGNGEFANEVIKYSEYLESQGYILTAYYSTAFYRCWAVYRKNQVRPVRLKSCLFTGDQYFLPVDRKTKKCGVFLSLEKFKEDFTNYLRSTKTQEKKEPNLEEEAKIQFHPDSKINETLNILRDLFHSGDFVKAKSGIKMIKEINSRVLEDILIRGIGYKKINSFGRYSYLYIKHGSIFKHQLDYNNHIIGNIWYAIITIIGNSHCKAATSLKRRISDLEFCRNENLALLPDEINCFTNIKKLSLRGNKIKSLPNTIGDLTELEELNLEFTDLTTLPASIGNLKKLRILKLFYSKIEILPSEIGDLESLEELDLLHNKISELPKSIENLKNIKTLRL